MLGDAAQRCEALKALAHAARCDAPQHEGREGRCILARRSPQQNTGLVRAKKNQPAGVQKRRRGGRPVSGLFFTGRGATAARAADTEIESRQIARADSVCSLFPQGKGWGEGGRILSSSPLTRFYLSCPARSQACADCVTCPRCRASTSCFPRARKTARARTRAAAAARANLHASSFYFVWV